MASTIKLKNGSGAPLASDLVQGEPALDLTNKRLYTEDSLGAVIEVGTNPTELQVDNINIDGNAITSTDTNGNIAITPNGTGEVDISKVDIDGGTIDGVTIGGASAGAGTFTTLGATGDVSIADKIVHTGDTNTAIRFPAADTIAFETSGSEAMRIDSDGRVGIGTTNPESILDLGSVSNSSFVRLTANYNSSVTGVQGRLSAPGANRYVFGLYGQVADGAGGYKNVSHIRFFNEASSPTASSTPGYLTFSTTPSGSVSPTERLRIDSSGNLLVGKTAAGSANTGAQFSSAGFFSVTRDADRPVYFNRLTDDGNILEFAKDSTTIGSIGVQANDIYVASATDGIKIDDNVRPSSTTGGSNDAAMDLGTSGSRFKDLYLSGGVYLGGTGSANHLDDYEEGTFTPTLRGSTSGTYTLASSNNLLAYTKIGRLVTVTGRIRIGGTLPTQSGYLIMESLPFTCVSAGSTDYDQGVGSYFTYGVDMPAGTINQYFEIGPGTSTGTFLCIKDNDTWVTLDPGRVALNDYFSFNFSYLTS